MHDPMSVAHEIYLGRKRKRNGNYKSPIITIWHVDPEKNTLGTRRDDSCGWSSPPYTEREEQMIRKLVKDQYSQLFAKKIAYEEEKSYAYICHNQDCFGAIYWVWRAMKNLFNKKVAWQYGVAVSNKEFQYIMQLATNPVDNFQWHMKGIMEPGEKGLKSFEEFVFLIYRTFRGYYRPWYKHPRWHIQHWKIQFHPWQNFYHKYIQKCCKCGKRGFEGGRYGDWGGTKTWCGKCEGVSVKMQPAPDAQRAGSTSE